MNNLTLSGRLTADPEFIDKGERPLCRMRIAVDNGRYPTTFIDVSAFDQQAYTCAEYLKKGRKVGVTGRLAYDEWTGKDGRKRQSYNVIGRVEFLDRPSESEFGAAAGGESAQVALLDPSAG